MVGGLVGAAGTLLLSYLWGTGAEQGARKPWEKKKFVGIELGGTNFNVAIGEPILNNKGQITDFILIKRKNGITYADPL